MRDPGPGQVRACETWPRAALSLSLALAFLALTARPAAAATPVTLDGSFAQRAILWDMEVLVDPTGVLTIDEVARAALRPVAELAGGEGDIVWLGVTLRVPDDAAGDRGWYLVLAHPYNPGALFIERGGRFDEVPVTLDPSGASFVTELPRAPGTYRVFLRAPFPLMLPSLFHVTTLPGLQALEQRALTQQGLYLGVILAMLIVNLLMGIGLRDRTHLWYVAFVASSASYFSLVMGSLNRFVMPTAAAQSLFRPGTTLLLLMVVTGVQFSRRFLDTPRSSPRLDRVMRVYMLLASLVIPLAWLAPPPVTLLALALVGAALPFVVLTAGVVTWRAGVRSARFYLIAWSVFTLTGFLFAVPFALPPGVPLTIFQIGSALEAALLSLALVDRMRLLREERLALASARDRAELEAARSERLAGLGQLVAGVAHEVNNPNNFLTFNLPILRDYLTAVRPHVEAAAERDPELRLYGLTAREFFDDAATLIANMEHGTQRIAGIVSQLRTYARSDDAAKWEEADVNGVVRDAVTLVGNPLRKMVRRFDVDLAQGLPAIRMSPGRIEQVVMNLLLNAGHAAQPVEDSRVVLRTSRADGHIVIEVEDNGPGVPAEIRARVFEPFFTTKERGQGTGMGLAISKRIVDEHGGALELSSEPGHPTRFTVRLPITAPPLPEVQP
ncbi:MAG: GHKL domain-containing protein [Deltaproteobacteria bacterium]|nr:GHKL domain-containing protein [Deltaproteobacteria bacterium]